MTRLPTLRRRYAEALSFIAAGFLSVIVLCLLAQTFARGIFSLGLPWSGELARFAAVWAALLGAAAAFEMKGLHVVDSLVSRLSGGWRHAADWLCLLALAFTLIFLIHYGWAMAERALGQRSSAMRISMAWVYAALPVAAGLMSLSLLADMAERLLARSAGRAGRSRL